MSCSIAYDVLLRHTMRPFPMSIRATSNASHGCSSRPRLPAPRCPARLDRHEPGGGSRYRIRNHPIDLYAWPDEVRKATPVEVTLHRGFGIAHWSGNGMHRLDRHDDRAP